VFPFDLKKWGWLDNGEAPVGLGLMHYCALFYDSKQDDLRSLIQGNQRLSRGKLRQNLKKRGDIVWLTLRGWWEKIKHVWSNDKEQA